MTKDNINRQVHTNLTMLDDLDSDELKWLEELHAIRVKGVKKPKHKKRRKKGVSLDQGRNN